MYVSVTLENWMLEKIHGLKKRGVDGDYQMKEMATVMDTPESIHHLYDSYEAFAWRKKGIGMRSIGSMRSILQRIIRVRGLGVR